VVSGFKYSLTDWNGVSKSYSYIGFDNFTALFKNPYFWRTLATTLEYAGMLVVGVLIVSLILALCLNSMKRFKSFTKSVFFIPALLGGVTVALVWEQLYYRVIPYIGQALNIEFLMQNPLASTHTALFAIVFVNIWKSVALPTIIFIAGLQTIPYEIYESAMIDGATIFQRFRKITFPYLLPTITVNLVLLLKQGFTTFDFPYAMTGGGPVNASRVIGILIYDDAFENMRFAQANAQAIILFVIVATISIIQIKISNRKGAY
jgi:raffinose/stachyose/melibiose transport system permease protein